MTDTPDPMDNDRVDAALMDYVRGKLDADEATAVEAEAARNPQVKSDIDLLRGIAALRDAPAETGPGEFGWARLSRAIDREEATPAPAQTKTPVRSWTPALRIAATALLAVGVWQFAVVPNLPGQGDRFVPVSETPTDTVTVAFQPDATEAQIRALLQEIGATITGGPNALGLWQIGFTDDSTRDAGIERLATETTIVESVQAD